MMKMRFFLLFFYASCAFSAPIDALSTALSNYQSLQSQFHQIVRTEQGKVINEANGTLLFKRPGQFYWKVSAPNAQLMIANGQTMWLYDEDLEQVTIKKQNRTELSPAALLSGSVEAIDRVFIVTQQYPDHFVLTPKNANDESAFRQIELFFKSGRLYRMTLRDQLGQISTFDFNELTLNHPIAPNQFQFHVPDGVDVIQDDA